MLCHSTLADRVLSSSSISAMRPARQPTSAARPSGSRQGRSSRSKRSVTTAARETFLDGGEAAFLVRTPAVVPAHDPEQLLAGARIEGPLHLQPAELEQGDLGEREDAAALLEMPAEGAAPVAERQVAVDVVVGDDAGHADDLHAARRTAIVEA